MSKRTVYRAEFFREGDVYIGLCPELDVSSFGETLNEARNALQEAVEGFVEACEVLGSLDEVMEEAGFVCNDGTWLSRQPICAELMTIG